VGSCFNFSEKGVKDSPLQARQTWVKHHLTVQFQFLLMTDAIDMQINYTQHPKRNDMV
jgi:hypothetical protein